MTLETHDGHQGLDVDGILLLEFEAIGDSHRLLLYSVGSVFRDLLDRDCWGKRGHREWVERYAIELETVALGGKFHLEITRNVLCPNGAFLTLAGSIWTTGAVQVDGL